jgi:RNA polymerase sigma-70 factor (ECF subfamily)
MENFRALHRFAVGLTGSVEEANDIVQTVFMRLSSRQSGIGETLNKSYLFTAVRNGAYDFWKRKRPTPFSQMTKDGDEEFDVLDETPGHLELAEAASDRDRVLRSLQTLTDEQREIISLKYFSSCSTHEIAVITGKNENAVRQMEFRALGALRKILQKDDKNQP